MADMSESSATERHVRPTIFRLALRDAAVFAAAVFITILLCGLAYLFPRTVVNPAIGSTAIANIPTSALLKLPRTVQTCQELLQRSDVDDETLHAALVRLGRLQHRSPADLLAELATAVDTSTEPERFKDLSRLAELLHDKRSLRDRIETLARTGDDLQTRRLATAMIVAVDGHADELFAAADGDTERLSELMHALPLVDSVEIQSRVYDNVRRLLFDGNKTPLQLKMVAITVMVKLQGREEIKAVDLIRLVEIKGLQNAAIDGFSKLPSETWPPEELGQFAARITSWIAYHSPTDRRAPELQTAMSLTERISDRFTGEKRQRLVDRLKRLRAETD